MATDQDQKRKQHRSPAYPSLGLKVALEHAKTIYKHEKRTAAPVAVVVGHCGSDIKSSKGMRLIAALKQYGLVVEEGSGDDREVRLSNRALDIELGDSQAQRDEAVKAAALAPPIHRKIWDKYGGELPSDATLRAYLLRELDFNDLYASRFVKQFRSTLAFAGLVASDIIEGEHHGDESDGNHENKAKAVSALAPQKSDNVVVRDFPIPLISGGLAVVKIPVPMSELDYKQITDTLTAWKPAIVRKATENDESDDDSGEQDE